MVIGILIFISGTAGLIYEILWMEQLGLLFGNSAQAAASTLAAFFLGLGLGSWWWGQRVSRITNALRVYAALEAGVLVCASVYFVLLWCFHQIYPWLINFGGSNTLWALSAKFVLALVLVCPAAFFMGGTLPVIGQLLVRNQNDFGRMGSRLYGINTLGATLGAYLAGFILPPALGYTRSYLVSLCLTAFVVCMALLLARLPSQESRPSSKQMDPAPEPATGPPVLSQSMIALFCFISGLMTLALEVLWTHMFSHVYENTVYTFAAIMVTTLLSLAVGAGISSFLARRNWSGGKVLLILIASAGVWVGLTPHLFMTLTGNMQLVSSSTGWLGYHEKVFALTVAVLGIPLCLLGTIFPYLLKLSEPYVTCAGGMLGRLAAINTAGAILGSLLAGFVLLSWWGLWSSIQGMAVLYVLLAVMLTFAIKSLSKVWRVTALGAALLCSALWLGSDLPPMHLSPQEIMVEYWHGASGTVAVVNKGNNRMLKVDGHYGLGGSAAAEIERGQTRIPLMLHPQARSIFFLGLGTGITAGEACSSQYGLKRIVACELIPEVVTASRKHFSDFTGTLFTDPRCQVMVDDGRNYLKATRETFDIINSDLFIVYRKGAGSLYSLEHFQNVKAHLAPNGVFVLWIPLYQLTKEEFGIIARTMIEVFPQVTAWRNQFITWGDAVALVGQTSEGSFFAEDHPGYPLDKRRENWKRQGQRLSETNLLLNYCGNLSRAKKLFSGYPLNTDDRPLIEYSGPISASLQAIDKAAWLAGPKFIALMNEMQTCAPPEQDPALGGLPPEQRHAARAGYYLARTFLFEDYYKKTRETEPVWRQEAQKAQREFDTLWLQKE